MTVRARKEGESIFARRLLEFIEGSGVTIDVDEDPLEGTVKITIAAAGGGGAHAADHENGGSDEIDVAGLSGELADDQPPKAHQLDGAKHTVSGLTTRHVMRATGASSFAFGAIEDADLPSSIARDSEVTAAVSALSSVYQPLNAANLTAIAALTSTAFGRGLLELANQAALLSAAGAQASDADLTAIAGLTPSNDDLVQRKGGAWSNRTIAQLLVDLAAAGTTFQPLDADLTAVAGLSPSNDDVVQRKAGAWTNRTLAQLLADLAAVPTSRTISNGYGIGGGGDLSANRTLAVALSSASAFATAETTLSAATYADITGASVSLAAGTWLLIGHVVARAANAIVQGFVAITDGANAVIAESALSRPASGTASLNSPFGVSWSALVSPVGTTTYKLRGARGLTTHTGSWVAMDGTGFNTTNHASNNSNKGTGIVAVRIA